MNYWHDIELGDNVPNTINMIVEIPYGSLNKYEIDKKTGLIKLDRTNYSTVAYPFNYGFAPRTLWHDNDPLDIVLLGHFSIHPGVLVNVRPIGVIEMIDDGESDNKIVAVCADDLRWTHIEDLDDLNDHTIKDINHFFKTYKVLKKGDVVDIVGVKGKEEAYENILESIKLYKNKFGE